MVPEEQKETVGKRDKKMRMNRLLTTMVCGIVGLNSMILADVSRPRLVVGIMVDQLRTDYIEYLQNLFTEGGFKKLVKDGAFFKDVDYKVSGLDAVSGTALIYTGNYPRYSGITSSKVYSPSTKGMVAALHDAISIGNFTSETYSPVNLRLSTLSDEIMIDGAGKGSVYSIAADPQQAIIMAGHAGNSAFWMDENTGRWATTTYYRDAPKQASQRNYSQPLVSRLDTMQWKPLLSLSSYSGVPEKKKGEGFTHRFPSSDRSVYRMFMASPMMNMEITDIAISYLKDLSLGHGGDEIDMLNLAYTVAPYKYDGGTDYRLELEDSYVRLDRQLNRLFNAIERYVGLNNTLIYLASTGYYDDSAPDDSQYRTPTGVFSVKRGLSLLNSYLSATYGNGAYVDTYNNGHVYLDHKEIEEKKLDLKEVAELSRDFLVKMSGVNDAFTMSDIMSSSLPSMEGLRLGTDPKTGGDVILEFNSGWNIVDDTHFPNTIQTARSSPALTPVFIMSPGIAPQIITETIDATAIAPTISENLRIRAPNGSISKPITLKK